MMAMRRYSVSVSRKSMKLYLIVSRARILSKNAVNPAFGKFILYKYR